MKTSNLLALISSGANLHFASAAVHFSFAKQQRSNLPSSIGSSTRRSVNAKLAYGDATYVVNVTVGTPGQAVALELSTSSADTWVMDARSPQCTSTEYEYDDESDSYTTNVTSYCIWGSFSPGNSTSCVLRDTSSSDDDDYYYSDEYEFTSSYNDGSYAYGDYMNDVLTIGGMTIANLTMGLVNETSNYIGQDTYMGVLGIGYNDGSSDNLPDRLLQQGLINTTAYSIWVDDDTAASGNLLFGAIDTTKFTGNLTRLRSSYSYVDLMVQVVGINATTTNSDGPLAITVPADQESSSGATATETAGDSYLFTAIFSPPDTLTTVPSDVAAQIWEVAGAYYHAELALALIGCAAAGDTSTNFTVQLGGQGADGPIITARMADLVIPASEYNVSAEVAYYLDLGDEDDVCLFGIQNASAMGYSDSYSSQFNLGSTLLRRTYSVFDLANSEVAVAPVVFGASATSDIVPFPSYGATVPSSTIECYYSDCYVDTGSSDSTDEGDGSSTAGFPGLLSLGALIGLSAGLGLGCLALGLVGFLVWRHRRNTRLATKEVASLSSAEAGQPGPEMSTAIGGHTAHTAPAPASAEPRTVEGVDKGKGPEVPPPLPPRSMEAQPRTSEAEASRAHGADHAEHAS